jgi:hypothetical protein
MCDVNRSIGLFIHCVRLRLAMTEVTESSKLLITIRWEKRTCHTTALKRRGEGGRERRREGEKKRDREEKVRGGETDRKK